LNEALTNLLDRAEQALSRVDSYKKFITALVTRDAHLDPQLLSEESLNNIAAFLINKSMTKQFDNIAATLTELKQYKEKLDQEANRLAKTKSTPLKERLDKRLIAVRDNIASLQALHNFYGEHKDYIELNTQCQSVQRRYEEVFKLIPHEASIKEYMKNSRDSDMVAKILAGEFLIVDNYPHAVIEEYEATIASKLNNIDESRYPHLVKQVTGLVHHLDMVKMVLLASSLLEADKKNHRDDWIVDENKKYQQNIKVLEGLYSKLDLEKAATKKFCEHVKRSLHEHKNFIEQEEKRAEKSVEQLKKLNNAADTNYKKGNELGDRLEYDLDKAEILVNSWKSTRYS